MRTGEQRPSIPDDAWTKSSYSSAGPTECVETALLPQGVAVRDSKALERYGLWFSGRAWTVFTRGLQAGHFT